MKGCRWKSLEGCRLFRRAIEQPDAPSAREVASTLGVGEGTIYFWKVGFRRAPEKYRPAIEKMLGVPQDTWLTATELGERKRLRALGSPVSA